MLDQQVLDLLCDFEDPGLSDPRFRPALDKEAYDGDEPTVAVRVLPQLQRGVTYGP
ncbi:hypothetical protein BJG92_01142 [Arthrobacter sp. SO5]|uniref:hypothetical protein n=1 Tax=Arthrobacter sp. SO5 TaxID=1897055 RepID=UPI001E2E64E9|nr:hypothetical protein [Arthrobacter sp. SO5]MCB5273618.1 hypothetical protein [Arthrobacter sp. SO5]